MNRTARLLVTGAGLATGAMFMVGPAQAASTAAPCCEGPGDAITVTEVDERTSVAWVDGPWFPEPDEY